MAFIHPDQLSLSLERVYKDDAGNNIPVLRDISSDGAFEYKPYRSPAARLGGDLRRIFIERGHDFFEQDDKQRSKAVDADASKDDSVVAEAGNSEVQEAKPMSPEELSSMRSEIIPQLHTALGEMSLARDLLTLFLSSIGTSNNTNSFIPASLTATPSQPDHVVGSSLPSNILMASTVTQLPPIPSVQSFDVQLVVGGKDEALRRAADIFKGAADTVERTRLAGDRYWMDALKIRRQNWALTPAPLPPGAPVGRSAEKTSKDFLISFGLSESPPVFRRRALGQLAAFDTKSSPVMFPQRQKSTLRVSLTISDGTGSPATSFNRCTPHDSASLDAILRDAQKEAVEQEIFAVLIRDASNLSSTSSRVSERLIVLEAAQDTELRFELVDNDTLSEDHSASNVAQDKCDLIYGFLHVLLLRMHTYYKSRRLGHSYQTNASPAESLRILQPVVDFLQYDVFCRRVKTEMTNIVGALRHAGVPTKFHFNAVGESSDDLLSLLCAEGGQKISGDALIRIDNSRSLRFTFHAPSTLTVHLTQAALVISSISQLTQLLHDETENCLLQRICDTGNELTECVNGGWFVDVLMSRAVGKWEGRLL
ncbi:subunit 17 of mediator complex-domain-containing protein [Amylostereum chailletii]|nr:subunit 17 of mediator complex-domain-containing protein [Amylostereum chailletii]